MEILGAGFKQADSCCGVFGKARRQNAASCAPAHNNVVKGFHGHTVKKRSKWVKVDENARYGCGSAVRDRGHIVMPISASKLPMVQRRVLCKRIEMPRKPKLRRLSMQT